MGKRRHGFLTPWQRDLIQKKIELKPSDSVDKMQRLRIEYLEIFKSCQKAMEDFRLMQQVTLIDEKLLIGMEILTGFQRWGKRAKASLTIPITCKCGFSWNEKYSIGMDKTLKKITTFGVPIKTVKKSKKGTKKDI